MSGAESRDLDFIRWQALPGEVRQIAFALGALLDVARAPAGDRASHAVNALQFAERACCSIEDEMKERSRSFGSFDRVKIAHGDVEFLLGLLGRDLALSFAQLRRKSDGLGRAIHETIERGETNEKGLGAATSSGRQAKARPNHGNRGG